MSEVSVRPGRRMTAALLLVDIQNDYFPGGAMEVPGAGEVSIHASALLSAFRDRSMPVIHIRHVSLRPGATFFLPDTPGSEIHPSVAPVPEETVFLKNYPSSFRGTSLLEHLEGNGISRLFVAGMMTQMCIDSTVRAAADLGFICSLAHDACAARDLSFAGVKVAARDVQVAYLSALSGLFARVASASDLLTDL